MTVNYEYNLTAEDVAKIYNYNIQYVRDLARYGKLPALKRGRKWLFSKEELQDFFRQETVKYNMVNSVLVEPK